MLSLAPPGDFYPIEQVMKKFEESVIHLREEAQAIKSIEKEHLEKFLIEKKKIFFLYFLILKNILKY
jgi:hypothetical protein